MADQRPAPNERRTAYYSGHVQGVGFRETVRRLAQRFEVSGFVRNLADGRVEVVVEGTAAELQRFLTAIAERMESHIRQVAIDVRPSIHEFTEFEIRS